MRGSSTASYPGNLPLIAPRARPAGAAPNLGTCNGMAPGNGAPYASRGGKGYATAGRTNWGGEVHGVA